MSTPTLARMISDRGTGLARMCTSVPSSISEPSTPLLMINAMIGSTTAKPSASKTGSPISWVVAPMPWPNAARPITSSGRGSSSRNRRRPKSARRVIDATVPNEVMFMSDRHQVGEDTFQGLVGGDEPLDADPLAARDPRQGPGERPVVTGLHGQPVRGAEAHSGDGLLADQCDRQPPVVAGP